MNQKLIFTFLILTICLTSCDIGQIKDTNGPNNFAIQTFSSNDIIEMDHSRTATYFTHITSRKENETTINAKHSSKKFSGIDTLEEFKNCNSNDLYIYSEVTSGNFAIALIYDNKTIKYIDINCSTTTTLLNDNYKLKIVGESANFYLNYKFTK